jgi:hypothetical protein
MARARFGSLINALNEAGVFESGSEVTWLLSCLAVQMCDTPRNSPEFIGFSAKLEGHKQ